MEITKAQYDLLLRRQAEHARLDIALQALTAHAKTAQDAFGDAMQLVMTQHGQELPAEYKFELRKSGEVYGLHIQAPMQAAIIAPAQPAPAAPVIPPVRPDGAAGGPAGPDVMAASAARVAKSKRKK